MIDLKQERIRRWALAGFWTVLIYATLYIVRPICEFLKQYSFFSFVVDAIIVIFLVGVIVFFGKKKYIRRPPTFLLLALVTGLYLLGLKMISIPEERVHFLEYGILAFLIYQALILDVKGGRAYLWTFILASLIGLGDEGIQHLLPNRYYQFQDVCLNSFSAALGLALVFVIRRDTVRPAP